MTANTAVAGPQKPAIIGSSEIEAIASAAALGAPFESHRASAVARVMNLPFPTGAHELWRYTKPDLFEFAKIRDQAPVQFALEPFGPNNKAAPESFELLVGAEAVKKKSALLDLILGEKAADTATDAAAALQLATVSSIAVLTVPKGREIAEPVVLSQVLPQAGSASSLVVIAAERGSKATIIEDLSGSINGLFAPRVEVLVSEGANLTFCSVQNLSHTSKYLARHRFHTGRDANLSTIHIALGSKLSRLDLDLRMYEQGANVNLLGLYLVDDHRHADMHPTQFHLAPNCRSDLFSKGVLRDNARSVYYGYIRVAEGAQQTDAYQTNRNLLLSSAARADSIPNLAIKANDVRCSHGASVSHVNDEDMFYLMTRGLNRKAAEELLVEGFLEELLSRVRHPGIHTWLSSLIGERLAGGR